MYRPLFFFMRLGIRLMILVFALCTSVEGYTQWGVFTEFTIDASGETTRLEGNIMDTNIGVMYRILNRISVRAGISNRAKRSIGGDYFWKDYYDSPDDMTFISQNLWLSHSAILRGHSVFGGIEYRHKKFMIGSDFHYLHSDLTNGVMGGNLNTSNNLGFFSNSFYFPSEYNSVSFTKLSIRSGFDVYKKPRGSINLFLNYSRDFSENTRLETLVYDEKIQEEIDKIPNGPNTSSQSFPQFLNSNLRYQRNYFSVGLNVNYFFNVQVEKPKGVRIGG